MRRASFADMAVAITLILLAQTARGDEADSLSGRASVIDGDTIQIQGRHVRLFGMDAPEAIQTCEANGRQYRCGEEARRVLADKIHDRMVRCEWRDIDGYEQLMAVCTTDGEDLGRFMVCRGWAIASRRYAPAYVEDEDAAKSARMGLWRVSSFHHGSGGWVSDKMRSSEASLPCRHPAVLVEGDRFIRHHGVTLRCTSSASQRSTVRE